MNFDLSKQLNLLYQDIDRSSSIQFLLNELLHDSESLSLPGILRNLKSLPIQDEASFLSQLQESLQIKETPILQNVTALGRDSCSEAIRTAILQKIEEKFTELLPQSSSDPHDSTRGYEALKKLEQSLENYLINPNEANKTALEEAVALEKISLRPQQAEFRPKFLKQEEPSSFASILKSPEFYRASLMQAATEILKIENPNQQKINDRFHSNDDPLSIGSRLTFDNAFRQNPLSADVPLLRPNSKQFSEIQTLKETLGTLDILKFMPLPEHNEVIDRLLEDKLALISKLQDSLSPTTLFDPELIEETKAFIKEFNKEKQKIESSRQELIKTLITEHSQSLTRNISLIDQESAELERLYQQIPDDSKIRTDIDIHIHSLTAFRNLLLADLDNFNRLSPKPSPGIFRTPRPLDIVSLSALFETSTAQLGRLNDSIRSFHTRIEKDLATVQAELLEQNKRQNEFITSLQSDHDQISQQLSSKSGDYDRVSSELSRINLQIDSILQTFSTSPTQQSISFSVSDASQALEAINANIKIKEERILQLQSNHALEIEALKEKHTAQLTRLEGTIEGQKGEIQKLLAEINKKELAIEGLNALQRKDAAALKANNEEIASLKQRLEEAQDQMRTTQDALGSLRGAQEKSSAELIEKSERIADLERRLLSQDEQVRILTESNGKLLERIRDTEQAAAQQIKSALEEARGNILQLEYKYSTELSEIAGLNTGLSDQLEEKKRELSALKVLMDQQGSTLEEKDRLLTTAQTALRDQSKDLETLQSQITELREAHKEQLQRQSEEFNKELLQLQTSFKDQLSQAQSINSTLRIDLEAKIASIEELQTKVSRKDVTLAEQESLLKDIRQEIGTKNIELRDLRSTLSSLTKELERQKVSIRGAELVNQNLLERLKVEEEKTKQQLKQLSSISTENTKLKGQLDEQSRNISLIMNELLINQESLTLARNELESKKTVEERLASAHTMIVENEARFEERIRILSEKNTDLSGEIDLLQKTITAQTLQISHLEDSVRQQEEKLGTLTNLIKEQKASIDATLFDNEELKTKLSTSQKELIASAKLLEQSQKDLQELRSTSSINLTEKNSLIEILDQRITDQDQAIVLLERKASGFESELADARRKIAEQQRDILSLSSENTQYIRKIDQLTAKTIDDASALTRFKQQLTQANAKLHQLSSQKGDIQRELRSIKQQLQTAQEQLLSSSAAKSEADDKILRLERTLAGLRSAHELSIQEKERQIENLKRTLSDTEDLSRSENSGLRREIDRLEEGLRTAQSDNDRLMGDYSLLEKELAKRAQIQQSQQVTIDEYFGELQAQEKTIGKLEKLNIELAKRNKTLEDENAALSEIIRQQEYALSKQKTITIARINKKIERINLLIDGAASHSRYEREDLLKIRSSLSDALTQIQTKYDLNTLLINQKKISEIEFQIKELATRIKMLSSPKITTVNPPLDPDFNLTSLFGSSSRAPVVTPINLLETLADKLTTSSSATRFNFDKDNPLHVIKNDAGDRIQELKIFIKDPAQPPSSSLIPAAHADQFTDYLSVTEKDGAFVTSYNISSQNKTEQLNEPTYQDKLNDFYEQQAATLQEAHGLDDRALLTPAKIKFEITSIADALELSSILIALNKAELKIELDLTLSQEICNTLKQEVTSIQDPVKKELIEKITAKHPSFINLTKELVEILEGRISTPRVHN